ncbi:MAG: outer membrane lipoprotein carrier protein LolA [Bacteroidetes bacterium]|nr:outer membrane lipoprotein carrier protein LolA [Bacteroidota bacterium]
MKKLLFSLLMLLFSIFVIAQTNSYTQATDSDPEATAILEKMRKKYDAYQSLEAKFELNIEYPEQGKISQAGTFDQQGDKYRLELPEQLIISNGEALWLYLKSNNEVQINSIDPEMEEDVILSPKDIFRIYEKGEFAYFLSNEFSENGKIKQQIEFKPLREDADYFKLRLTLDKKTLVITQLMAFGKDGSRYSLEIHQLLPNKSFTQSHFTFDKSQYPDVYVEDLRY